MLKDPKGVIYSDLNFPDGAVGTVTGNEKAGATPQKLGDGDK
jgi:hypothetical protein